MTIEEFIREVEDKGIGVEINGSILTLHEIHEYNFRDDPWSPLEIKSKQEPAFLICDMFARDFVFNREFGNTSILSTLDMAAIIQLVTEVADTPVKERFEEQVWRLRWLHPDIMQGDYSGYLCRDSNGFWKMTDRLDDATLFTSSDLEKLKAENPTFAPAIDAIKEPAVKENE